MSEKRFDVVCVDKEYWRESGLFLPISDKNTNKKITLKQCLDLLNGLDDENQQLREFLEEGLGVSQVEIDEELRRMKEELSE